MNTKPLNKLKEGAVPMIFLTVKKKKTLKMLSSEDSITKQPRNRWKLANFLAAIFSLTKMCKLQNFNTFVKCYRISSVTKWLDWIILYQRNFIDRDIVLDTSVLKNVYCFLLLFEKRLWRSNTVELQMKILQKYGSLGEF